MVEGLAAARARQKHPPQSLRDSSPKGGASGAPSSSPSGPGGPAKPVEGTAPPKKLVKLKSIDRLEFLLIGECVRAGYDLLNIQEKRFHEGFHVAGILGHTTAGDPRAAAEVQKLFGKSKSD